MNILVVNQYFPPDASATAAVFIDLVDALAGAGHDITVLCGRPSYDPSARSPWRFTSLERIEGKSLSVERIGSTAFDRRKMVKRIANYFSFLLLAAIRAPFSRRPDLVIAGTDPPLGVWVALMAARGRPVIYGVQDLHPDVAVAAGWVPWNPMVKMWDSLHRLALRRVDYVVTLSDAMARRLREKGARQVQVIPNGARPPEAPADLGVVQELRGHARLVAVHAGNVGAAGAWNTIARAAELIPPDISLVFVGGGAAVADVTSGRIRHVPFRPVDQISSVMDAGDLQIVTVKDGLEEGLFPSKLHSILAYGRPILAVVPTDGDIARFVRDRRCGLVADPSDPDDVVAQLVWARDHPEELKTMSDRARQSFAPLSRDACMRKWVNLVNSFAQT